MGAMRKSLWRSWARVRTYFGVLVFALVLLGVGLIYASSLAEGRNEARRAGLRRMGLELMGLAVFSVVLAGWLKRRYSGDD